MLFLQSQLLQFPPLFVCKGQRHTPFKYHLQFTTAVDYVHFSQCNPRNVTAAPPTDLTKPIHDYLLMVYFLPLVSSRYCGVDVKAFARASHSDGELQLEGLHHSINGSPRRKSVCFALQNVIEGESQLRKALLDAFQTYCPLLTGGNNSIDKYKMVYAAYRQSIQTFYALKVSICLIDVMQFRPNKSFLANSSFSSHTSCILCFQACVLLQREQHKVDGTTLLTRELFVLIVVLFFSE